MTDVKHPIIIQGGMGVGVSNWRLVRAVCMAGQLGVVSGVGLDTIVTRRLQDGDAGAHTRRALAQFPVPQVAQRVMDAYFIPGGRPPDQAYRTPGMFSADPDMDLQQLTVVANFVEVLLAKEGHDGPVGINYLERIQLPNLASIYGAMLAGVDYVCIGAGIPREIPGALDKLARLEDASLRLHVEGAASEDDYRVRFSPREVIPGELPYPKRPVFLAIVSSPILAASLAKKATGEVDGFVVEGPTAGGHIAPPRGPLRLNERGEPIYGPKDAVDLEKMRRLGRPFWLAGSYGEPERLRDALDAGATGVQIGTPFAFCEESGIPEPTRQEVLRTAVSGEADVLTDPLLSPTGFPFKVVRQRGTLSEASVYEARPRACDLSYLRHTYKRPDGSLGYRCPAEPVAAYVRKGGQPEDTVGRKCLCNALIATVGQPQVRKTGYVEDTVVTAGDALREISRLVAVAGLSYSAQDVISYVLRDV